MRGDANTFRYLNRAGRWLGFALHQLEVRDDGALQLWALPRWTGPRPVPTSDLPKPAGPAGLAVDRSGTLYAVDPKTCRIIRTDACTHAAAPLPCITGRGSETGRLDAPAGLLVAPHRDALLVADSGNHRVQILALDSGQTLDVWDGTGPGMPDGFVTPVDLAADRQGNVYVADRVRVRKVRPDGDVDPSFEQELLADSPQAQPIGLYLLDAEDGPFIYVLDGGAQNVFAVDSRGRIRRDENGEPIRFGGQELTKPSALAADFDAVYVGDNAARGVQVYKRALGHRYAGSAVGYDGPVAGLALDAAGFLLVHTGASADPVRLELAAGYSRRGIFWAEAAIESGQPKSVWQRLQAKLERRGPNAHLQLYVAQQASAPPVHADADEPFPSSHWRAQPIDVDDLYVGGEPGPRLWIGGRLLGDGASSPILSQLRVEFDTPSYLHFLPAIYREEGGDFLSRLLSLYESFFDDTEDTLDGLPALFDPGVAPTDRLPWLASWMAVDLKETWPLSTLRAWIGEAFERYERRGTPIGLQLALVKQLGVRAVIEEPIQHAAIWVLPGEVTCRNGPDDLGFPPGQESSVLGLTTRLAPAEPQGAVLGTTAVLDGSHLLYEQDFAAPLFGDVAHQVSVQVYRGDVMSAAAEAALRDVLDRECPAHVEYHLCVIEPRMRVGFQARLGIDTVVSGKAPSRLDDTEGLLIVGGESPGEAGHDTRVGVGTRL